MLIGDILKKNNLLVRDLSHYDRIPTISLISSFLTLPEMQYNLIRFEALVALATLHCRGEIKPKIKGIDRWYKILETNWLSLEEDPAEDVFVSLVQFRKRDYLVLSGLWQNAGFYTLWCSPNVGAIPIPKSLPNPLVA